MILGVLLFHCHSLAVNKVTGEAWWQQYQVENITLALFEMKVDAARKYSSIETLKLNPTSSKTL